MSDQDEPIPHAANNDRSRRCSQDYDSVVNCGRLAIRHAQEDQLHKVLHSVEVATSEGANRVTGGMRVLAETGGFYLRPTSFSDVSWTMPLAREEAFRPVLAVTTFEDEAEAIKVANATAYGWPLAYGTSNLSTAHRMVTEVRAGLVHVNCYGGSDLTVSLGGAKQSGNGYDKSLHALDKFTDLGSAWMQI